ncbi:MAG TPA: 6-bladed beta-propeller [Balneolales bacterium]|nr:6-bladed beta-propeller [Balneolales bacterium]
MILKFKVFLFLLLLTGCSGNRINQIPHDIRSVKKLIIYSANTKPKDTISFKRDAVYGNSNNVIIGKMGNIAVDHSGCVFIPDIQKQTIDVFKSDGKYIKHLGRHGKGPGEFTNIRSLQIRNQHLYAYDLNQTKINVFKLDSLTFNKTILLAENRKSFSKLKNASSQIQNIYVRNNNTYIADFTKFGFSKKFHKWQNYKNTKLYYFLNKNGKISSKLLFKLKYINSIIPWPPIHPRTVMGLHLSKFFGSPQVLVSSNNTIYTAEPDYFLIKIYKSDGNYNGAFYYPFKKIRLTTKSATEAGVYKYLIKDMKMMNLPRTWPALYKIKIDTKNRIWVSTIVKNMKVYQWWVLTQKGKLLARFNWPRNESIQVIKNGYIYTKETNKKGSKDIVRYRFKLK